MKNKNYIRHALYSNISTCFFSIFQYFNFPSCWGGGMKGQKNSPKWQNILSVAPYISGTIYDMNFSYGTHVWKDNISRAFFIFLKFWFPKSLGDKRAKNAPKWQKIMCLTLYISNHTSYDCDFWCTCVKW